MMKTKKHFRMRSVVFTMLAMISWPLTFAQLGSGWSSYSPTRKIHLDDESGLKTFNWTSYKSVCSPICADYRSSGGVETFRILDSRSNRSEIRLQNEYSSGSRQFQGEVRLSAPTNDESLFQIFGSTSGATQLMIRGYSSGGGSIRATGGGGTLISGIYGKWVRINVIHLQEDKGNRIMVYINGQRKINRADNERVTNYHKYGCYGTMRTSNAKVEWRNVRHYRNGSAPKSGLTEGGEIITADQVGLISYPNPAKGLTNLSYNLTEGAHVELAVYDLNGRKITTVVNQYQEAGGHEHTVDVTTLKPGLYFVRLFSEKTSSAIKLMVE